MWPGFKGSGRTELLHAIFGAAPFQPRDHEDRRPGADAQVAEARRPGTDGPDHEDRKAEGLSLNQSILDNALSVIRSVFPRRTGAVRTEIPGVFSSLEVIARDLDQEVQYLSGGNQQKVVLAKWLDRPRLVLLDEPTRGIDVGAKVAVYRLMRQLAAEGKAILMVSSELPEVIGMSDRIVVMRDGRLVGELPAGTSEEAILHLGTGARTAAEGEA